MIVSWYFWFWQLRDLEHFAGSKFHFPQLLSYVGIPSCKPDIRDRNIGVNGTVVLVRKVQRHDTGGKKGPTFYHLEGF